VFVLIPVLRIVPNLVTYLSLIFAISRYRLWEVDLIINRGLVVGGLAVLLGLVFFGVVALLGAILEAVTGTAQSQIAVVASALLAGALFNPIQKRLQRFVDRRLYGIKVNFRGARASQAMPAVDPPTSRPPRTFGEYVMTGVLGRGGMGEVYRARQPNLNREVAVKVLTAAKAREGEFRQRFEREAQTVAALHHPNIIQVFDYGSADGDVYMVMEYIDGQGLDDYIREHAPLPLNVIVPLMRDICSALDYAHDNDLVHRDIKPSNVMLRQVSTQVARKLSQTFNYRAVLMDFGVARMVSDTTGLTQSGVIVGTFDYMAPEQISGSNTVDRRADIYSLGVMLYQMLTGQLPFAGDNPGVVVFAHLQRPPPNPREIVPGIPASVAYAVTRAMAKHPEDRFQRAGELAAALDAVEVA
jgi:serine/threonine protein kinase